MKIRHGKQLGLPFRQPLACGGALTLRAMPIATTAVSNEGVSARRVLAARDIAAEGRRAAALDGAHHLQLAEADAAAVGLTPSGTVVAEDLRDLQSRSAHLAGVTSPAPVLSS